MKYECRNCHIIYDSISMKEILTNDKLCPRCLEKKKYTKKDKVK